VAAGTLQAGAANALGTADYAVESGAVLDLNRFSQTIGAPAVAAGHHAHGDRRLGSGGML